MIAPCSESFLYAMSLIPSLSSMIVLTDKLWLYGFNIVLMEQVINSTMSFCKSEISCCLVISVFRSRTSRKKLNNIHENCLCLVTNECDSNFNELLESSHEISTHKTCINYLMIEVYISWRAISWINDSNLSSSEKSLQHS